MCCPTGGFPTIRHNEIHDLTAKLLTEVCPDVCAEPQFQPLTGENLSYVTANREDSARLDTKAHGFGGSQQQCAYFDVRILNPNAPSCRNLQLNVNYRQQESEKHGAYEQ